MKQAEAEAAIRSLCYIYAREMGLKMTADEDPSFDHFYSWVGASYSAYLNFRATIGVREQVELWFDEEFKQMWRR